MWQSRVSCLIQGGWCGSVCHKKLVRGLGRGGGFGLTPWCVDLVCSWRRLLADRHSPPFPWTLPLHRRWCPSASHHPLTFLFLLALTFPLPSPFPSLGLSLCRPPCPSASPHSFPSLSLGRLRQRTKGGGGGGVGGALWSPGDASCRPGGGAAWQSWPRGPAIGWGVAPFPRPPLPRAGFSRRPSLGPLIPRPLSRSAGQSGVTVRVSGQSLAGCGAAGSPPRSLSPHSLPREVARPLASCRTVGGAWAGGPSPPPQLSRTRRLGLHLRRRLCGGWGCGGGGLCRR